MSTYTDRDGDTWEYDEMSQLSESLWLDLCDVLADRRALIAERDAALRAADDLRQWLEAAQHASAEADADRRTMTANLAAATAQRDRALGEVQRLKAELVRLSAQVTP